MEENNSEDEALLSIIIPCFNESEILENTICVVSNMMNQESIPFEILLVDDGSTDGSWKIIKEKNSKTVRGIRFTKNFGKESAIMAGLKYAKGECCAVMDCDLQHPPETLIEMYIIWKNGTYKIIEGVKTARGTETAVHRILAKCFYHILSSSMKMDIQDHSDFKLLDREVVNELLRFPEKNLFFRAMSLWMGYESITVYYEVGKRSGGKTKWSKVSLVKYAFRNIAAFSAAPLQIVTLLGIAFFVLAIIITVRALYLYFSGQAVEGVSTVVLLILVVGGITMISLGIIGYYISKIYEEIQGRPRFIVDEVIEDKEGN